MLIGQVPASSISYWLTAETGRDVKILQSPLHNRGELLTDLAVFLYSAQEELSCDIPPFLPVAQLLHSSADPIQITSNCLFYYNVSHIIGKII
jgi:hypothetical protein